MGIVTKSTDGMFLGIRSVSKEENASRVFYASSLDDFQRIIELDFPGFSGNAQIHFTFDSVFLFILKNPQKIHRVSLEPIYKELKRRMKIAEKASKQATRSKGLQMILEAKEKARIQSKYDQKAMIEQGRQSKEKKRMIEGEKPKRNQEISRKEDGQLGLKGNEELRNLGNQVSLGMSEKLEEFVSSKEGISEIVGLDFYLVWRCKETLYGNDHNGARSD